MSVGNFPYIPLRSYAVCSCWHRTQQEQTVSFSFFVRKTSSICRNSRSLPPLLLSSLRLRGEGPERAARGGGMAGGRPAPYPPTLRGRPPPPLDPYPPPVFDGVAPYPTHQNPRTLCGCKARIVVSRPGRSRCRPHTRPKKKRTWKLANSFANFIISLGTPRPRYQVALLGEKADKMRHHSFTRSMPASRVAGA